jgi:hypothetical protein
MKKLLFLLVFIPLVFACSSDSDDDNEQSYPTIRVVNGSIEHNKKIRGFEVSGFEIEGLDLLVGESAEYELLDGVSTSPTPVTVTFACGSAGLHDVTNPAITFSNGQTTIVTLRHLACDGSQTGTFCNNSCLTQD